MGGEEDGGARCSGDGGGWRSGGEGRAEASAAVMVKAEGGGRSRGSAAVEVSSDGGRRTAWRRTMGRQTAAEDGSADVGNGTVVEAEAACGQGKRARRRVRRGTQGGAAPADAAETSAATGGGSGLGGAAGTKRQSGGGATAEERRLPRLGEDEEMINTFGGFDLVIGGSPCNNLSGSNRYSRDGLEGKHSSLVYDYFRILDLVKCIMGKNF
ncbi:alanine and glycine-rich protein-like [Phoenix dactylifera]|uniref:Alanine and glycine-rich protein-like n=1 Tax=Phoenix dactylifera TaxID=42345 RepID=A0A8B8ZI95_PHODC|nr:alanine and glycine-rich protein-like [Phoenix dactylifera]